MTASGAGDGPRTPEEALAEARRRVEHGRERGEYSDVERLEGLAETAGSDRLRLLDWAVIEVDPQRIYSTRRLGAPITAFKRVLLRLLHQYHGELVAQQSRFNINVVAQLIRLEERVEAIERAAGGGRGSGDAGAAGEKPAGPDAARSA